MELKNYRKYSQKMQSVNSTIPFGWHDFTFHIPEPWCMGEVSGTRQKGYLRIDDVFDVRMEIKWETHRKAPHINSAVEKIIKTAQKETTEKGMDVRRNIALMKKKWMPEKEYEVFSIGPVLHVLYWCTGCRRFVMIRCFFEERERVRLFDKIFQNFRDHPSQVGSHAGLSHWGVFYLWFRIPSDFELIKTSVQVGEVRLGFSRKRDFLEIGRASLADFFLKKNTIEKWLHFIFAKELRNHNCFNTERMLYGRKIVMLNGKRRPLQIRHPKNLVAFCWHDVKENAIYYGLERSGREPFLVRNLGVIFD